MTLSHSHCASSMPTHAYPCPPRGAVCRLYSVESTPVRRYAARIALSHPDHATFLARPKPAATQSVLVCVGLHRPAWTRRPWAAPGKVWALRGACRRFEFALQTLICTRCAPAAMLPPPGDVCGSARSGRLTSRCGQGDQDATQAVKLACVAHVERVYGNGLAFLRRPPASVALRMHGIARCRVPRDESIDRPAQQSSEFD